MNKWHFIVLLMAWIAVFGSSSGSLPQVSQNPTVITSGWTRSGPEEQGLNPKLLNKAFQEAAKNPYIYSLLVVKNGYLVRESYFNGSDVSAWDLVYSVTKSVTSALVGIAIEEGYIDSVDQRIIDYFPEHDTPELDSEKRKITIRHLLTMQSGIDTDDNLGEIMSRAPDMAAAIMESDLCFVPGTDFLYSSYGTHLLSVIITRATGTTTREYAREKLFTPLGIRSFFWETDPNGIAFGGGRLHLAARDMARFGQLYLQRGLWKRRQVIPAGWIDQSLRNHRSFQDEWGGMKDAGYGFCWWTGRIHDHKAYAAWGHGGQWIWLFPEQNLMVVSTMNAYIGDGVKPTQFMPSLLSRFLLPALGKSK
ncbi:MAG TPA: class C beta-lactamase-related serine hydrolase [bacterium]|nr:class C beta-lactamase-related serine hydrolase [bacterium]